MNGERRNPGDPIENLAIGKIIEVRRSHLIAELAPGLTELWRFYAGEAYPIGQFGWIVRIHFGRRLIYALVGRAANESRVRSRAGLGAQCLAGWGDRRGRPVWGGRLDFRRRRQANAEVRTWRGDLSLATADRVSHTEVRTALHLWARDRVGYPPRRARRFWRRTVLCRI